MNVRPSQYRRTLRALMADQIFRNSPLVIAPPVLTGPTFKHYTFVVQHGDYAGEHSVAGAPRAIEALKDVFNRGHTETDMLVRRLGDAVQSNGRNRDKVDTLLAELEEAQNDIEELEGELFKAVAENSALKGKLSERLTALNEWQTTYQGLEIRGDEMIVRGVVGVLTQKDTEIRNLKASVAAAKAVAPADANPLATAGIPSPVGERPAFSEPTAAMSQTVLDLSRAGFSIEEVTRRVNARLSPDQWFKVSVIAIIRELAEACA